MWLLLKGLALRFLVGRTVGGLLGTLLLVLVPLGGILKVVGLPILMVLGVLGAPLFLLLGLIGLPILFVLAFGGILLAFVGVLLAVGIFAIKIILPIVLIVWFVRWIFRSVKKGPASDVAPPPPPTPEEPLGPVGG
ncbi:MAG: hypothetical protein HOQ15_10325 [Gemmatimonadaceae bacterium]|nr:hypothetical protein [Gemmatimonadaceae bacterium]NUS47975.1 hypothetical protein [Gemmatimonadaceae bacterium]